MCTTMQTNTLLLGNFIITVLSLGLQLGRVIWAELGLALFLACGLDLGLLPDI